VDETALLSALYGGRLAGAVLDVFQQEPLPPGHPLWDAPNPLITAHTSALSFPGDIVPIFVENFRRMQADEALLYIVDFARGY
jgi:glyoxylate/hydroxypyruvate reductase A